MLKYQGGCSCCFESSFRAKVGLARRRAGHRLEEPQGVERTQEYRGLSTPLKASIGAPLKWSIRATVTDL